MEISKAQEDMRHAFYGGASGVLVSATAWLLTGIVAINFSELVSIVFLYIAGMFIFPISVVLSKILGRPGTNTQGNSLSFLGLESTGILLFCYPIAYVASLVHIEWFFPAMLIFIGVRYLMFTTLYGSKLYWVFGFSLILAGYSLAYLRVPFYAGAFVGAAIEYAFGLLIYFIHRHQYRSKISSASSQKT